MRCVHVAAPVPPLARVALVWSILTVATLCGPCRPPVGPQPALASEATP